jgi:hypothetical protein
VSPVSSIDDVVTQAVLDRWPSVAAAGTAGTAGTGAAAPTTTRRDLLGRLLGP